MFSLHIHNRHPNHYSHSFFESSNSQLIRHACEIHEIQIIIEDELKLLGMEDNMWTQHYLIYHY